MEFKGHNADGKVKAKLLGCETRYSWCPGSFRTAKLLYIISEYHYINEKAEEKPEELFSRIILI